MKFLNNIEASKIIKIRVSNENQMIQLANTLAPVLPKKGVLLIDGTMGSGKTFLCRHLIQAKQKKENNYFEDVPSPTFTIIQTYEFEGSEIWHCDFYRLETDSELIELGLEEGFKNALCLVEWPKKLKKLQISDAATLKIMTNSKLNERELIFHSSSKTWKLFAKKLESINFG